MGANVAASYGWYQVSGNAVIKKTGVEYYKEMYLSDIEKKWGVDLSAISAEGTTTKRWDYVVKTESTIYVMETNFYTSGGSKLNETSRSYKLIAEESKGLKGVKFVWVTDGGGWVSARRNLHETFDILPTLFNITDLENALKTNPIWSKNALSKASTLFVFSAFICV